MLDKTHNGDGALPENSGMVVCESVFEKQRKPIHTVYSATIKELPYIAM